MIILETPAEFTPAINKVFIDNVASLSNRILLQSYAPTSVTTNSLGNILYVHGDTSRFMRQPAGVITTNLLDMARDGLQIALRAALQAAKHGTPTLEQEVSIKTDSGLLMLRFSVRILTSANPEAKAVDRLLLVSFQEVAEIAKPKRRTSGKDISSADNATRIEQLQRELTYSRESLQATIERQQATNEELKSSNEELQSSNEELQSTNEELDTAKEEMQSLNEETLTVNSELSNKIELSSNLQNDMKNLMDNVNVGIIFLDYQLNIRSYTREALKICHFIAADVGRPLGDITFNLQGDSNLLDELHAVLETLVPYEREVQSTEGVWYLARIQPYRTLDNVIDGIVLTFTNIDLIRNLTLKLANVELTKQLSEGIVNTIVEPLVVLNADLQVISASRAFYQYFKVLQEQTVGKKIYDLGNGQWNIPSLRKLLDEILPQQITIENFVVEHNFPELGPQRMMLNARRIKTVMGDTELILLAIMDLKRTD